MALEGTNMQNTGKNSLREDPLASQFFSALLLIAPELFCADTPV